MPVYKEKEDKLVFKLHGGADDVKLSLVVNQGADASVSFGFPPKSVNSDHPVNSIGKAEELKGQELSFDGAVSNPFKHKNNILLIVSQGSRSMTYGFPRDYTGTPEYTDTYQTVAFSFTVKFE